MNILVLGGGGREHALCWKISQSPLCGALFIAPGNAGTATVGANIPLSVTDFTAIERFCVEQLVDLVVVGPEDPLVAGIYDHFQGSDAVKHVMVIGPSKAAAQLEGSKAFSKAFMQRHDIPTAAYAGFTEDTFTEGLAYIDQHTLPIVLKADGLAAGKGVVIATTTAEAREVFTSMIKGRQFGDASSRVVIEQFLSGIEISVFVLTDGSGYQIIGHAKDYKRIGEGDTGLNTGGMGCVTPVPFADDTFMRKVITRIIEPTVNGLHSEQLEYKGFIFFGLIKVDEEPFVIEYNCRMGDPETEVVLPVLESDLVELLVSIYEGKLSAQQVVFKDEACATVMAVSGGYPGDYEKGKVITGLEVVLPNHVMVFHAATKNTDAGIVTSGGRVLTVTSLATTLNEAVRQSKQALAQISFDGMYFRSDIGYEF